MAKYSSTIAYNITTTLDSSGIAKLQSEIHQVENELRKLSAISSKSFDFNGAISQVQKLRGALNSGFNSNLGILDTKKFMQEFKDVGGSVSQLKSAFDQAGAAGIKSFNSLVGSLGKLDGGLKSISSTTEKIFNTIGNTVRWGVIASAFQGVMNSMHNASQYLQDLDYSLNQIRIVSEYNAQQMRDFSLEANKAAQALGQTTVAYTDASLIFAQQGYSLEDSERLAELTLKVANTTGQQTAEVSEQITSWVNGYQMSLEQLETTLDKVTKVAAVGASDTEELMTAAAKVASVANMLGVTEDQLITQMSTIISVTREAPENIGNSLKTIYARLGDLQKGEELEDGVTLGKLSGTLEEIGIQILDDTGAMRNMGDVLEELMTKWNTFDRGTQQALAVQLAGKFQYSRFSALMQNKEMYDKTMEESLSSEGFLDRTQDIYMESWQAKVQSMQAAMEGLLSTLFNPDDFKPFYDALTDVLTLFKDLVDSIGGGTTALTAFGAMATKIFSSQIANGLTNLLNNRELENIKANNIQNLQTRFALLDPSDTVNLKGSKSYAFVNNMSQYMDNMSTQQIERYETGLDNIVQLEIKRADILQEVNRYLEEQNLHMMKGVNSETALEKIAEDRKSLYSMENFLKHDLNYFTPNQLSEEKFFKELDGFYKSLATGSSLNAKQMAELEISIKHVKETFNDRNAFRPAFEELLEYIEKDSVELDVLREKFSALKNINSTIDSQDKANQSQIDEAARKARIDNMVKAAGAIGQLAFAMQSVNNIPSIFSNEDLSTTEKMGQLLLNIGITLPMLISSFQTLRIAIGGATWANVVTQFKALGSVIKTSAQTIGIATTMQRGFNQTLRSGIIIARSFGAALKSFFTSVPGMIALMAAFEGVSFALGAMEEAWNNYSESQQKAVEKEVEKSNTYQETISDFKTLYEQYKETGEVTDELKESSQKLADSLGISGGAAMIAAGQYKELADAAEEAANKQNQAVVSALETQRNGSIAESLAGGLYAGGSWFNSSAANDFWSAMTFGADPSDLSDYAAGLRTEAYKIYQDNDYAAMIGAAKDQIQEYNDKIAELKKADANADVSWYNTLISKLENFLNADDVAALNENLTNYLSEYMQSAAENVNTSMLSGEKLLQLYMEDKNVSDSLKAQSTDWYEQAKLVIANVTDSQQKVKMELAASKQNLSNNIEDTKFSNEEIRNLFDYSKQFGIDDINYRENPKALLNSKISRMIENANLTNAEKIQINDLISSNIDSWKADEIISNVKSAIEEAEKNSDGVDIAPLLSTEHMQNAINSKTNLNQLVSQYQEKGSFTEDEAASILKANPEYMQYLIKVGDQYMLNTNALKDWNAVVEEQTGAIEDAYGAFNSHFFDEWQDSLENNINVLGIFKDQLENLGGYENDIGAVSSISNILESIKNTSQALEDGKISVEDYFNSYEEAFNENNIGELFENIESYSEGTQAAIIALSESLYSGLSNGVNQAKKQLVAGNLSLTDYNKMMIKAAKSSIKLEESMRGITRVGDKYQETIDKMHDGVENLTEENEDAAVRMNDAWDNIANAESLERFNESLTNNYDYLSSIMSESGQLTVDWDSVLNTSQFQEVTSQMADGIYDMIIGSEENFNTFLQSLGDASYSFVEQFGSTYNEFVENVGETSNSLREWMLADLSNFEAAAQAGMVTSADAMAQLSQSIDQIFSGIEQVINSFEAKVEFGFEQGEPFPILQIPAMGIDISVPTPKLVIKGSASVDSGALQSIGAGVKGATSALGVLGGAMSDVGLSDWAPKGSGGTPAPSSSFTNPGGSGGSGGGGGGGKGSSPKAAKEKSESTKDPEYIEALDKEVDLYEKVNAHLDRLATAYSEVAEARKRSVSYDMVDLMNKEIDLLKQEIGWQKAKAKIQQGEDLANQQNRLKEFGIQFDAEGYITNYGAIWSQLSKATNNAATKFNYSQSDADKEAYENLKKRFDKFEDYVSSYDKLQKEIAETQKDLADLEDQIEDIRIEAYKTSVEAAKSIKDIQEKLTDFNAVFSGLKSDDPFRKMAVSAEKLGKYFDVATDSATDFYDTLIAKANEQLKDDKITTGYRNYLNQQIQMMQDAKAAAGKGTMEEYGTGYLDMQLKNLGSILAQIQEFESTGKASIFGEDSADMYDVANDIYKTAIEMIEDFEDEIDDLRDAILDAIDDIAEEMERRLDQYEAITDELEHQASMIEMLRGETAYDELNKALAAQQSNYKAQINELHQELEVWKDLQTAMTEGSEEWLAIQKQITSTQSELNDLIETALENLQKQYENMINKVLNSWTTSALGNDLDWIESEWELINRNADYYLDSTNAAYNIQKLQGKYLELLDNTNDLHTQQKITQQMQEQLGYLREKEKISEYDVAYAEAQLQILQKRIALEEAQANKTQMKLKRDSQGNYSYVYTANDRDTAGAEQDLLDAQNNAYNLSKEQMKKTQDDSLSALQDAKNMLNQIWTDANLTLEEKTKRTQTIVDSLKEYLQGTSEQLSTSETNIINDFIGMVEMMTDENNERLQDVYEEILNGNNDAFDQIDTRWATSITNWLQHIESFEVATDDMFAELVGTGEQYQSHIDELGDLVGQNFNDMSDAIQNTIDKTNELASSTSSFISQLKEDAGVIQMYEKTLAKYSEQIANANNEMKAYQEQVNKLASKLTGKEQTTATVSDLIKQTDSSNYVYSGGSGYSGTGGVSGVASGTSTMATTGSGGVDSGSANSEKGAGAVVGFNGRYFYDSWGTSPSGSQYAGQANAVRISSYSGGQYGYQTNTGDYMVHIETLDGSPLGWVKADQLFDTGGYTGTWTDGEEYAKNGKLAFLHQKELVLNESDTANILEAVKSVREMTSSMKTGAFSNIMSALSTFKMPETMNQEIQQNVHIEAVMPNVTDGQEIQNALMTLTDGALQYANSRDN